MNSVANNMVATLMNSKFGANLNTSTNAAPSSDEFSAILGKTQMKHLDKDNFNALANEKMSENSKMKQTGAEESNVNERTEGAETTETATARTADTTKEDAAGTEPTQKSEGEKPEALSADEKELDKTEHKVYSSMEEAIMALSDTGMTEMALDERLEKIEDIMVDFISDFLGISEEELQTMMQDMGMTPLELMQMQNISTLVAEFFGLDSFTELLLNEEAVTMIKEIDSSMKSLLESISKELGMDLETLQTMVADQVTAGTQDNADVSGLMAETAKTESDAVNNVVSEEGTANTEEVMLEVDDKRAGQDTTEYSQDNTGKEEQSFANILSNNADVSKEVVVINNGEQVVYKEISANEVINQIVTKAVVKLTDTNTTMQLQLNPGHLGKIAVSVTSEQGIIKGHFVAESQVVKEMLESNIAQLKEQLEGQGIKVDKIEVTVGSSNQFFDQGKEQQQQSKDSKKNRARINRLSRMRSLSEVMDDLTEAKQAGNPAMDSLTEHTVDFSA